MIKEIIISTNELVRKNMDVNGQWRLYNINIVASGVKHHNPNPQTNK
jgi:hypothetical protein